MALTWPFLFLLRSQEGESVPGLSPQSLLISREAPSQNFLKGWGHRHVVPVEQPGSETKGHIPERLEPTSMHYGLGSWHIWHKLKQTNKQIKTTTPPHCLKRPWTGTYKAKHFSCRQENAGRSAKDELVRKYPLPVDTPKTSPTLASSSCRCYSQQNTPPSSSVGSVSSSQLCPGPYLPMRNHLAGNVQTNQPERFG